MTAPLHGLRCLDFTRVLAGPFLTQMLAALGADVVKVEPPEGDPTRRLGAPEHQGSSYYFHAVNGGKRSIALDLQSAAGRRVALELAARADVVIENFRPGVMDRLGLGAESLRARNRKLAILSISGFGQDAPEPERSRPSFDLCAQARGGVLSVNGPEGGPPVRLGVAMGDLAGALFGGIALLATLVARARGGADGGGATIDVSLLDAQLALLGTYGPLATLTGAAPSPAGSAHPSAAPYDRYEAADGDLVVAVFTEAFWPPFLEAIARPELARDARFRSCEARVVHRGELDAILRPLFKARPRRDWIETLARHGVPAEPVQNVLEALGDPAARARGSVRPGEAASRGSLVEVAFPAKLDGALGFAGPAPAGAGCDRERVLGDWLSLSKPDVLALEREGAFGSPAATQP